MRVVAGSWLITGDAQDAPLADGAVALDEDDRVACVGVLAELTTRYPHARVERRRAVLMPGLVNAHTHLELSALRGQVPGGRGFGPWVAGLLQARERVQPEQQAELIEQAVDELLAAGTAAVGEVSNTLAALAALGQAPLQACLFHEVFGMQRQAAEVMLGLADQRRAELGALPDNVRYALAPHTTFTLHPDVLRTIVARTRSAGLLTSVHLAEHGAERAFLRDGSGPFADFVASRGSSAWDWPPPGLDPVRHAQALGVLASDVLCVHLADARPDELELVARSGARVVLCPASNLHIELRLPPLLAMLELGLRPALGTDSLASCASLDVLQEARALGERFPTVPARTLLAMATSWGAEALGLSAQLGTLAAGKQPGLIAFAHEGAAPSDPERFVLSHKTRAREVLARPARRIEDEAAAPSRAAGTQLKMEAAR